jgi:hypothetical protein
MRGGHRGAVTSRLTLPRHSLLPDLQRSRAVLVGCDDGVTRHHSWGPEEMVTNLAGALTAPGEAEGAAAFRATHTDVLLSPGDPADMLDAVRSAAAGATDTLLFFFVGRTSPHRVVPGEPPVGPNRADGVVGSLGEVARIIGGSEAVRSVVVLDGVGHGVFAEHAPTSFVLAGSSFGLPGGDQLCSFTPTLVSGLRDGVRDGPEMLDLLTLVRAVEAWFHEARYNIEDDWVLGPARLTVRVPMRFRMVALGANPVFGNDRFGGLPRDEAAVDKAYDW